MGEIGDKEQHGGITRIKQFIPKILAPKRVFVTTHKRGGNSPQCGAHNEYLRRGETVEEERIIISAKRGWLNFLFPCFFLV